MQQASLNTSSTPTMRLATSSGNTATVLRTKRGDVSRFIEKKPIGQGGRVSYHLATEDDLPAIYGLIADFGEKYAHAIEPVHPSVAEQLVAEQSVFALTLDGYTVGALAFTDHYPNLHAEIHLLVRPWAMRDVLRSTALVEIVTALFISLKLVKLKGKCLAQQVGAKRLLKSYGFRNQGYLKGETIFQGKLADMELYELTQQYWLDKWIPQHDVWQREES